MGKVWEAMKSVLNAYRQERFLVFIRRDNGLIYASAPGKALTWMDAVVNGTPVTQRGGYAVEINALWYNAVCFALGRQKRQKTENSYAIMKCCRN